MRKVYLSVGFADLTDFSKLVNHVGAEISVEILQDIFKKAGDIILKHGGRIIKYIGDTVMFTNSDPRAAVLTAQEICESIVRKDHNFNLRFFVSVCTGEVLAGKIGHPSHMMDDVMGEVVNRAALMRKDAAHSNKGYAFCPETTKYMLQV